MLIYRYISRRSIYTFLRHVVLFSLSLWVRLSLLLLKWISLSEEILRMDDIMNVKVPTRR